MLSDVIIPELVGYQCLETGIDSRQQCLDRQYFDAFPLHINYQYNQRGFRDLNWPTSFDDSVCCIGDSFTVGLGLPFECIWPRRLQNFLSVPVINISMDGASNQWILRMCQAILAEFRPRRLVCMWSYAHRRENKNRSNKMSSMQRRVHYDPQSNWYDDYNLLQHAITTLSDYQVIHLVIPNFHPLEDAPKIWQKIRGENWAENLPHEMSEIPPPFYQEIIDKVGIDFFDRVNLYWQFAQLKKSVQFVEYQQSDWARDRCHLGVESCGLLAEKIARIIGMP